MASAGRLSARRLSLEARARARLHVRRHGRLAARAKVADNNAGRKRERLH